MKTKTYTKYLFTYLYGGSLGDHVYCDTLKQAWEMYKAHKAHCLANGGSITRMIFQKHLLGKDSLVKEEDVVDWLERA